MLAVATLGRKRLPESARGFALDDLGEILSPQVSKNHRRMIAGTDQAVVADRVVGAIASSRAPTDLKMLVAADIDHAWRNRHRHHLRNPISRGCFFSRGQCMR